MAKRSRSRRSPIRSPNKTPLWMVVSLIVVAVVTFALVAFAIVHG